MPNVAKNICMAKAFVAAVTSVSQKVPHWIEKHDVVFQVNETEVNVAVVEWVFLVIAQLKQRQFRLICFCFHYSLNLKISDP